jgi:hypothetical protein
LCYIFKYAHSQRHNDIKQIISNEEIEEYVDPWTKKYVQNHIMPNFSSWLNALDALYLKEFPRKTVNLGSTTFTTMGVIENYKSHSNVDGDSLFFVIWWFKWGMMFIPLVKFMYAWCWYHCSNLNVKIFVNKSYMGAHVLRNEKFVGGWFVMLGYKLYFQPRPGTIFLLKTPNI